jgi:hypothetical protein
MIQKLVLKNITHIAFILRALLKTPKSRLATESKTEFAEVNERFTEGV